MGSNKKFFLFYVVAVVFLTANSLYAQNYKKLDSILKEATTKIYINPDSVIKLGKMIVKQSGKNVDYKIKAYKLIADAYSSKRDYEKSLDYVIKANELLNDSNDKLLKITILNKTGIQYHQLKVYDKAIQYLDQAEQLIAEYPFKDSIHSELGINNIVRGFIYKEKLSCAIAIHFFDIGIAELLKFNQKSDYSKISIAKYNKGNCYLSLDNNKLALENFEEAIVYAKKVNAKSLQAFALKGSAQVYTLQGKSENAIKALNDASNLSAEVDDLILNGEIYKGLAKNYLATNQWEQFRVYDSSFISTQKLIKYRERKSVGESLAVKETESKEKLKGLSNKFYYSFSVLFLILALIIVFFYMFTRKKLKEIEAKKRQIFLLQNEKVKQS